MDNLDKFLSILESDPDNLKRIDLSPLAKTTPPQNSILSSLSNLAEPTTTTTVVTRSEIIPISNVTTVNTLTS